MEAHSVQPGDPSFPRSLMFLVGVVCYTIASLNFPSVDVTHETITGGRGEIAKLVGICVCEMCFRNRVSSTGLRKCHRDRRPATMLCFPLWCWEKSVHSCSIRMRARWRDHASWVCLMAWSKLDLCIHPTADELSLQPSRYASGGMNPSMASIHMVMMIAMNSRTLLVWGVRR